MKAAAMVAAAALALLQPQARTPAVRLHHLHFQADDPATAMAEAIAVHGGTRAIVQGRGVGVRVNDVYLLFDRPDAAADPSARLTIQQQVAAASAWLEERSIRVTLSDTVARILAARPIDAGLDHVAFSADDITPIESVMRGAGSAPVRRTAESMFFRGPSGVIEITTETERPDAYWCPMHPGVRAAGPRKCPVCAMDLVPIAPPRAGEYWLDVTQVAGRRGGLSTLKLRIRDPESGRDVPMFSETHERLLHLFVISRDLQYFAHEHPERTASGFELRTRLPAGMYMLIADFIPGGGYPQMVHRAIVTPGYTPTPFVAPPALSTDLSPKAAAGMRVALRVEQAQGKPQALLRFRFTDAATGQPVNDLQPYLGAAGHLLVVSPDLTQSVHAHPEATVPAADLDFSVTFPKSGFYKLWVQVQRRGLVSAAPFVVEIAE